MIILLFLTVTSTAMDTDTARNTVRITSNDGNSGIVGVRVVEGDAVGEAAGAAVGVVDEVDEPEVDDVELGAGVGLGVGVGDGLPLLLTEL